MTRTIQVVKGRVTRWFKKSCSVCKNLVNQAELGRRGFRGCASSYRRKSGEHSGLQLSVVRHLHDIGNSIHRSRFTKIWQNLIRLSIYRIPYDNDLSFGCSYLLLKILYIYHHHDMLLARVSLTLSRHSSLSSIASGRSSR